MLRIGLSGPRAGLFSALRANSSSSSPIFRRLNSSQSSGGAFLSWNDFLAKRLQRRRVNLAASVVTGFFGMTAGWAVLANIEINPAEPIFGFDAMIVLPLGLLLCAGAGSLLGPSVGSFLFKASLGKSFPEFAHKNAQFLRHVQRNRPDPSKQTYANPVPDYYGEKIGSLKDYRRWLRDCRAYRRKVETFL
ncbi:uncharacterized protein SAPINGB_P003792 [Magnusiomyces paraingens]|uniref:Presequence translocated-associated motor subunit PAM17 n=1 Tax=Magnusiomyces paraingens TaxID=2606893 RepID=A0A5E8BS68_9ASCO|nr:uncharacterized protein SAPINGB_P003792 [Saprochaete ingens]VVT53871.1 unnamed protein product [Saprochaete ingens]